MTKIRIVVSIGAVLLAAASTGAAAADMENAKKKVTEVCQACHGMDGNSPVAENPKLAGQHPDYLAKALRDYKSGARKNPVMGAMASTLTTKDIADLAAYFSSQPAVLISRY
jgi:cytochrome c553